MTKTEIFVSEANEIKMLYIENQFSWLLMRYLKGGSICLSIREVCP